MLRTIRRVLAEIGHSQNQIRPLTKSPARGSSPDGASRVEKETHNTTWLARNNPQGGELSSRAGSCHRHMRRENPNGLSLPGWGCFFWPLAESK